ncbi:hypothetical protein BM221_004335 [Beauveria bassiana]|uniref:Uncharacterized protein n=1 Tax=Beauveria bassiana TaxID=176275 RepID=A0A2N6NQY5_BEABA|nr:hypothetical protein BM221_004335 [Beauveria bassiana]
MALDFGCKVGTLAWLTWSQDAKWEAEWESEGEGGAHCHVVDWIEARGILRLLGFMLHNGAGAP